jgi:aerobic carbon-monoxide dehydrogenase small subunit
MEEATMAVELSVNGERFELQVEARRLLSDFLREDLGLTGTHVGCEHGVCGACTVRLDGLTVRSCLLFAVQASGSEITTVEGVSQGETLHPLQAALSDHHGLQCGFCTPGMIMTALELLERDRTPSETTIRHALAGNLCRCTGYEGIVRAIESAARSLRGDNHSDALAHAELERRGRDG